MTELKREVEYTTRFKKDYKRETKGRHRRTVAADMEAVIAMLADDVPLPAHMVDHALTGNWRDHRDCHVKPDLVLIYRKVDALPPGSASELERAILQLVRLGSHSELGL